MKLRKKLRSSLWSLDGFDQLFNRSPKSLLIYIKKQSDSQQKAVGWVSTFAGQVEQEGSKLTALVQGKCQLGLWGSDTVTFAFCLWHGLIRN